MIGIISGIIVASLNSARNKGGATVIRTQLAQVRTTLQQHFYDNGVFPPLTAVVGPYSTGIAPTMGHIFQWYAVDAEPVCATCFDAIVRSSFAAIKGQINTNTSSNLNTIYYEINEKELGKPGFTVGVFGRDGNFISVTENAGKTLTSGVTGRAAGTQGNLASTISSITAAVAVLIVDDTPASFVFTDQPGVNITTLTLSNILQITGIDTAVAVSISGGGSPQFRICTDSTCSGNPAFGTSATTMLSNQWLQLQLTSSASTVTAVSATVTVGLGSDNWSVTTWDNIPDAFVFTDQTGVAWSTLISSNILQIIGINGSIPVSISGGGSPQFRTCSTSNCSAEIVTWGSIAQTITNNQFLQLRLTSSASAVTALSATVTVGTGSDNWSVTTVPGLYSFTTHTFTNMGAQGRSGPTAITYSAPISSNVTLSSGRQLWTVPRSGTYEITMAGAQGGAGKANTWYGGGGGVIRANLALTQGAILTLVVGQRGGYVCNVGQGAAGAGGASIVSTGLNSGVLMYAGGGSAGGGNSNARNGIDALSWTSANAGTGNGGVSTDGGGSGGGALASATGITANVATLNGIGYQSTVLGGTGGTCAASIDVACGAFLDSGTDFGGFGGGGGGEWCSQGGIGGGGGYTGGNGNSTSDAATGLSASTSFIATSATNPVALAPHRSTTLAQGSSLHGYITILFVN